MRPATFPAAGPKWVKRIPPPHEGQSCDNGQNENAAVANDGGAEGNRLSYFWNLTAWEPG
ncbi:hypothetical protein GCM10023212_03790 [Luteolibacter yonseiensis]